MIELKLADSSAKEEICKELAVSNSPSLKIYVAREKDEVLGYCGFSFLGESGTIEFSKVTDASLMMIEDGLLRASLSLMLYNGVKQAACKDGVNPKLLRRLGFKETESSFTLELQNSFLTKGCCSAK